MPRLKKSSLRMIVSMLVIMLLTSACSGGATPAEEEEAIETLPNVALVMNGPINDMEWNSYAYEGLLKIEEQHGAEISYAESVSQSDMEDVFRNYGDSGFDLVFGHGAQFVDAAGIAAEAFPDTQYCIINGFVVGDNLTNISIAQDQQGYLMGTAAALRSESGIVGVIGGMDIPPIADAMAGFEAGAKYVNPDIEVIGVMVGDFENAAAAKEIAMAMMDEGADIIGALAGAAGLGAIDACTEQGILAVGDATFQLEYAPDTVFLSAGTDLTVLYTYIYDEMLAGHLEQKIYAMGVKDGAIYVSNNSAFDDVIPEADVQAMTDIVEGLISGEITTK
jgi:basic membrane protein A